MNGRHKQIRLPELAELLSIRLPNEKAKIAAQANRFAATLAQLNAEIELALTPYRGIGVVSDHGGLEVFLQRYGLRHMGSLRREHHGSLSLKRVRKLHTDIELGNTRCLAVTGAEAGARDDATNLFSNLDVKVVELDLLGLSADNYAGMLRAIAGQLKDCLAR